MAKFVFCVVAAACLISSAACFPSSKLPLLSPRETSSPNLRLRGGGWFDTRTPVYWPVLEGDKEEIPEDGSYGGHYSLEEVCGDMECEFLGILSLQNTNVLPICLFRSLRAEGRGAVAR